MAGYNNRRERKLSERSDNTVQIQILSVPVLAIRITPMIDLNLGGQYTLYDEGAKTFNHMLGTIPVPVTETYNKETWLIGVGLDFSF